MKEEENTNTEFEKVLLIAHFVFLGHIKFAVRIFCAHNAFCREKEDMVVYDHAEFNMDMLSCSEEYKIIKRP